MSFRKRKTVLSATTSSQTDNEPRKQLAVGVRPSPLDGRLTTSTGTLSLDALLAGHAGLPLGSSLLVEEQGTTDFAGVLLKYYAAEGLVQGHSVHVLGFDQSWKYGLPALSVGGSAETQGNLNVPSGDKMKIAWRYEALSNRLTSGSPATVAAESPSSIFCHSFDLGKRLAIASIKGTLHPSPTANSATLSFEPVAGPSLLKLFIKSLQAALLSSPPTSIHRVVVPTLLSPMLYPAGNSSRPSEILQFLHSLRALLRQHSARLTAMLSLQSSLYLRSSGLTRWMELLCDGVIELIPLPDGPNSASTSQPSEKADSKDADKAQGMVRVYTLPVYHEKGGGGAEGNYFRENLSFLLSSSKGLVIQPYSLPPLEDENHKERSPATTVKEGIEF